MLLGRDTELAACQAVLDGAREGRGGALVLHGEAGVGKSAVLAAVAEQADGFRVLTTSGIESESPLAFAALHRLLLPLLPGTDRLPAPQAQALRAVFGLGAWSTAETGNERFLVFLAALGLLADAAEDDPVLCVVDDAHWLDEASAAALLFVARRIGIERVAVLFGARDGGVRRFDSAELPALALAGLDEAAAERLLLESAGADVPREVRAELVERTGGNPLALIEIPGALSAAQLEGEAALPAHLPLSDGLERVFLDRHDRLPDTARTYLLVAAADDSGDVTTVDAAAARLGAGHDGREQAERSGLLRVQGTALELRHPLVRSAIYSAAPVPVRRRVHASLAAALVERGDGDRAVWHRAAAMDGPDEVIAADLERLAQRARSGGGHEASSAAWERAADLTGDERGKARRLHEAAAAAWLSGQPNRSRVLAQAARSRADDPVLLADVDRLRAILEMNFGSPKVAHGILLRAARDVAAVDPQRARGLAMMGTALAAFGADSGIGIDPLAVLPPLTDDAHDRCFGALLAGLDLVVRGDLASAVDHLRRALAAAEDVRAPDLLTNIPIAAVMLGDDEAALRWHDIELAEARQNASPFSILHALTRRAVPDLVTGRWADLRAAAAEALDLAETTDQPNQRAFPLAALALVAAYRGEPSATGDLEQAERLAAEHPAGILDVVISDALAWGRGLTAENPADALHHFAQIGHAGSARAAVFDRFDAAGKAGRGDLLQEAVADLHSFGRTTGARWAQAAAEHGRALLADGAEAEAHFRAALAYHEGATRPFNRARTELAYGEFLRRARRRVDSREHLRAALVVFEELGAAPWAERAREELRASGESVRRRDDESAAALTPQERQVARLVQQGLANKEVAARLFVSPRTVDFHLRNVFAKLGISSRGGLLAVDLDAAA